MLTPMSNPTPTPDPDINSTLPGPEKTGRRRRPIDFFFTFSPEMLTYIKTFLQLFQHKNENSEAGRNIFAPPSNFLGAPPVSIIDSYERTL